ncbi:integrase catalytic domain-containing protein [Trichonephila clavata]|uniref:Integrase catalytic domain-containing protein n=1 Tax=Trichonephila clavata TaxID=2740835 RepID=A0A8X6GGX9_TRICU|nr:integrase catalytic domain-containing protein [Trichonephila clavata]
MIRLAREGFGKDRGGGAIRKDCQKSVHKDEPTAATLISSTTGAKLNCIFCDRPHLSQDCQKLFDMSYEDRKAQVIRKRCCLVCLKVGHLAKRCHSSVRCLICKRRHYPLLCPDLRKGKESNFSPKDRTADNEQRSTETLLTNLPSEHEIYLKTIMIRLRNRDKEVCARALLDDGSQRSYIEKNLAAELFLSPSGREIFSQGLFGGGISPASEHKRYMVNVESLNRKYSTPLSLLEQQKICSTLPRIHDRKLLSELSSRGIKLTDVGRDSPPIRVLLGADILGSILTGRIEVLSSGVSAVETLLGWTILGLGKKKEVVNLVTLSLQNMDVPKMWDLEVLGITDPIEKENESLLEEETLTHFKETIRLCEDQRYEVALPWLAGHPALCDKYDAAESRLRTATKRLINENYLEAYDNVFKQWESEELEQLKSQSIEIMKEGAFELRCWASNDSKEDQDKQMVLGLSWDVISDELSCKLPSNIDCTQGKPVTKRVLLSVINSVYDPIGFTAPALLLPKLLMQEAWRGKIGWDEVLPVELEHKYRLWERTMHFMSKCAISRRLFAENYDDFTVHIFTDASAYAYAACAFLRCEFKGQVTVKLMAAKARLAPMKKSTIPRLELLGATLGARLAETVDSILRTTSKTYFWCDSMVVLSWIKKKEPWNTFVGNRVKEIRDLTNIDDWRHVPGEVNPADLATRCCDWSDLLQSKWWEGPGWLYNDEESWPCSEVSETPDEAFLERRKTVVTNVATENEVRFGDRFLYFSSYRKILRMTAYVLRFCNNIKRNSPKLVNSLSCEEIQKAEETLIKIMQPEWPSEIHDPKELKPLTPAHFIQDIKERETFDLDLIDSQHMLKRVRYLHTLRSNLRKRFYKEYLGELVRSPKVASRRKIISPGEIVIVESKNPNRMNWPLAQVIELFPGKDGVERVAKLRLASGEIIRPLQRIYPLELSASDHLIEDHHGTDIAAQNPGPTATDVLKEGKKSRWGRPLIPVKRLNL